MLVDARDKFLERMARVYLEAFASKGPVDANERIVHLSDEEKNILRLKVLRISREGK